MFNKMDAKMMRKEFRQQLADDLKQFRKTKKISIEELNEEHGIPLWLLEEAETTQGTFRYETFMSLCKIYEKYPVIRFYDESHEAD